MKHSLVEISIQADGYINYIQEQIGYDGKYPVCSKIVIASSIVEVFTSKKTTVIMANQVIQAGMKSIDLQYDDKKKILLKMEDYIWESIKSNQHYSFMKRAVVYAGIFEYMAQYKTANDIKKIKEVAIQKNQKNLNYYEKQL